MPFIVHYNVLDVVMGCKIYFLKVRLVGSVLDPESWTVTIDTGVLMEGPILVVGCVLRSLDRILGTVRRLR